MFRWIVIAIAFFAIPALAQNIDPDAEGRFGDIEGRLGTVESGVTTNANTLLEALTRIDALENILVTPPPVEPPPVDPPPSDDFAALCDADGVLLCEPFDDLSQATILFCPAGGTDLVHCPEVQSDVVYEGGSALQLTTVGDWSQDVSGSVGFEFPDVTSGWVYTNMRIRFGDGYQAFKRSVGFRGSKGEKHFLLYGGNKSCSNQSVVSADSWSRGIWQLYFACSPPVRVDLGNDFDIQPVEGQAPSCLYTDVTYNSDRSGCVQYQDDVWHSVEMAIHMEGRRTKLWVDGVLVIDWVGISSTTTPNGASGPVYDKIRLLNYMTGYGRGGNAPPQHPGKTWRIYYDNLIVSTECITSC